VYGIISLISFREDLRSAPVAVAHSKAGSKRGTSEISSCNYPARAYGLKNGMLMQQAVKLCPALQVLHYDFEQYSIVSEEVYRILFAATAAAPGAMVQPVSVDEAYLELAAGSDGFQAAAALRRQILERTGCPASVGVGSSMLTARLATKSAKPDGIFVLSSDMLAAHLSDMSLGDLPGVGYKHRTALREKGCTECKDIWPVPEAVLSTWLGESLGTLVFNYSRGIDNRALKPVACRKSVGVDVNYGIRFSHMASAEAFVLKLAAELSARLKLVCYAMLCYAVLCYAML
jgi:DNA repair protein REV1